MRPIKPRFASLVSAILMAVFVLAPIGPSVNARPMRPFNVFTAQDKKKPIPPARYIRSRDFDSKHIALNLHFKWDTSQAVGTEEFTFSPLKNGFSQLDLDAGAMEFTSVRMKDGDELDFDYDEDKELLSVKFDTPLNITDTVTIVIDYATKGEGIENSLGFGGGGGLKFIKPTKEDPSRPYQIWSQGESEYNRYWFPSYDYPNDFRTTELTATVKKPLMVISNGVLAETKDNSDGTRTYHWKMDTPYANYLTSIVVGEYTEVKGSYDGIPISTWVYPDWKTEGEVTAKRLPEMVKYFSDILHFRYPYKKYAQTIGYEFNGGMENISATTQTDNMIIDARTELDSDQDGLQAHELAHQWFGDYVTCRDWSEIWLNESFATYMEALWTLKSKGKDEFLWAEVKGNQDQYLATWKRGQRRPIVTKNYADPDAVFDTYAYPAGGAVLHMLRKQLGDEEFFRALNHYLRTNANKPVETENLRIAFEEATGQSMDRFFNQWLYRMGHPDFEVSDSWDQASKSLKLTVKQTQKIDLMSDYPQVQYFKVPVDIEIVTPGGSRIERVTVEPKETNEYTFENVDSKPLLVDFDNESTILKELKFEKPLDELIYQLQKDKDVLGRRWALDRLTEKAMDDAASAEDKAKVLGKIRATVSEDGFYRMRREAIRSLRQILVPSRPLGAKQENVSLDAETKAVLVTAADDDHSIVRADAIAMLGLTGDAAFAPKYERAILSDKSYSVIEAAAVALARTKDKDAYPILRKLAQTDSWRDRLMVSGLRALFVLGNKNALDLGFKFGSEEYPPSPRKSAALLLVAEYGKGDPKAFPLLFNEFKRAFAANDFSAVFSSLSAFAKLADPRGQQAFDQVRERFKSNQQALQFVDQLEKQFKEAIK